METVKILRVLWHRRLLLGGVALAAVLTGLVLAYEPSFPPQTRQYDVGVANGRLLVDTPRSQVVDVAPRGSETLGARAGVLAALMTEGTAKEAIARRAGLDPDELLGYSRTVAETQPTASKPPEGEDIHLLTTRAVRDANGVQLPIVEFQTQAPTAAGAAELAAATVAGLRDHLASKAAGEDVAASRRLSVGELGIEPAGIVRRGPSPLLAFGAALLVLLAGCAAIVAATSLARAWREAERAEHHDAEAGADTAAAPIQPQLDAIADPHEHDAFAPTALRR
jgi:hypothetical protein